MSYQDECAGWGRFVQVGVEALSESGRGSVADAVLVGACDMHRYGNPEMSLDCRASYSDADNLVLTSDYFFDWFPPASEAIRLVVGTLLQCSVSIDAVKK